MRFNLRRNFFFFLSLAVSLAGFKSPAGADTFYGNSPTGLLDLSAEYRYPVFLYVPQNYKPDRKYPLIITVPDEGESPEKNIEYWTNLAKRRSLLVLSATNLWPEDTPYSMDEWILKIKREISQRYQVDPSKIFLTGKKGGAQYAGYLATNYPEEFSAVVLMNGHWDGKFGKLLHLRNRPAKQIPFLVVANEGDQPLIDAVEKSAAKFEKKGYLVTLMKAKEDEQNSQEFKEKLLEWGQTSSETWGRKIRDSQKSWKEKSLNWMEKFFRV
ncbi:MAG TPA: hypothetical protein VL688_09205 [Verrucomicrobiae bacterium]|nr:hypothetical protein [Verrucomicrobiae bacterium]